MTVTMITGGTRGIGREVARQLAEVHGHRVLLGARDLRRGRAVAAGMRGRVEAVELDVTNPATIDALAARLDGLDVLVNNAGVQLDGEVPSTEPDWAAIGGTLEVNLLGPWRVTAAVVPLLRRSPHPRIVNVSSSSGLTRLVNESGDASYCVSKAGLNMLTKIWSVELPGVLVNAACPGWVQTDMGGPDAPRTLAEGVQGILWLATLPDDGPTGRFYRFGTQAMRHATAMAEAEVPY
ncbi:MAG TPA: SDR family NAD(P)-dependent oxidoreductase [Actinophytocola sp.]|uniref:SDR family NAD(P)-dependent oxidoreductase n=1 Tax=Actinophytocola sp. TaxID=1872138 RepID=UPI002E07EF16|nr:SDR family NAD(P)-dependent oxidoreductase [Actinophytocola sp.]